MDQGIIYRRSDSSVYRFAHDKIHQALYSLATQLRRPDTLHLEIGRILQELRKHNEDVRLTFLRQVHSFISCILSNVFNASINKKALLNYRKETDPLKLAAINIDMFVSSAFQPRKMDMIAALILVNNTLILLHGFTDEAGSILSMIGVILAWTGDFTRGCEIGELAVEVVKETKVTIPITYLNFYGRLYHLNNSLPQSLELLLHAYRTALR
jgi:hypothetical protein